LVQAGPLIESLRPDLEAPVTEVALPAALQSEAQALLDKVQATQKLLSEFRTPEYGTILVMHYFILL
jgi:hypothetical protein